MVVAIDGPAGSGKSSIARKIANEFGMFYMNSGNIYRALTATALREGVSIEDPEAVLALARSQGLAIRADQLSLASGEVWTEERLHSDAIDAKVAQLSTHACIRAYANHMMRHTAKGHDIVVDGRDITTVVFPNAEHRFYLDASIEARTERRFRQGTSELSRDALAKALTARDSIDSNKVEGRLRLGENVVYIDTSLLTIDQVYDRVANTIRQQGKSMDQKEVAAAVNRTAESNIQTQLQEQYLKSLEQLEEGDIVDGSVVEITSDTVFIDVGYKSEGTIPRDEFTEIPKMGDTVSVVLIKKENADGKVVVSKKKADEKIFWRTLSNAFKNQEVVEGTIEKVVKGGYDVNLNHGFKAFLPISQADVQKVDKPEKLLGLKTRFVIDRLYSDKKINIVVTRRNLMEKEIETNREAFFNNFKIGDDVKGAVKSFTSFGAFIDLGGFDGLLHINDMSWGHVARPKDYVKKGQEILLKVIRLDPEEKRINLSLKHFTPDPWSTFEDRYHVNDVVDGTVTKLTDFGAFIELEEGIEGLAHISEFSWVRKVKAPQDVVKIGDKVKCMVLGYDLQAGRVSLGLKQVTKNPWDEMQEKYPVGMRLTRKIVKITSAGAFVELEDGIDGFLHSDDLSWLRKSKSEIDLQVDQDIEVMVIENDIEKHSIRLGIKQLSEDPWDSFKKAFRIGSIVEGEVTNVTDFGVFLKVQGGLEGLLPKSNLTDDREQDTAELLKNYKVGDIVKAVVMDVSSERQKITFSLKDYQKRVAQEEMSQYIQSEGADSGYTLGDILKSKN